MLGGVDASLADATTISVLLPLLIYQTYMYVYTPVELQHPPVIEHTDQNTRAIEVLLGSGGISRWRVME